MGSHAGEITRLHAAVGTVTKAVRRAVIDDPVYVEEEKELVLENRPADGGAKLVVTANTALETPG